jgi:predicted membrane-bound spermidine synthase
MGDWGDNFFLVMVAQKTGLYGLQRAVASGWVRGAVTGVGLLNLAMAFWEIFHFGDTVRRLQGADAAQRQAAALKPQAPAAAPVLTATETDAANAPTADNLSHHGRRDD